MDDEQGFVTYTTEDGGIKFCDTDNNNNNNNINSNHIVNVIYGRFQEPTYHVIQKYFIDNEYSNIELYARKAIQWDDILLHIRTFCILFGLTWLLFGGDRIIRRVIGQRQRTLPKIYYIIQDNGIPLLIFWFLLAPQIATLLSTDNVFDIYIDKRKIFSIAKLGIYPAGIVGTLDEEITKIINNSC